MSVFTVITRVSVRIHMRNSNSLRISFCVSVSVIFVFVVLIISMFVVCLVMFIVCSKLLLLLLSPLLSSLISYGIVRAFHAYELTITLLSTFDA